MANKDSKIKSADINQINFDQRRKRRYCGKYSIESTQSTKPMMTNEENARIINKINQINLDQHRKRRYCGEDFEEKLK